MSAEQVCVSCGYAFQFDAAFFSDRNLAPPRRCSHCRAERQASRIRLAGVVVSTGQKFSILEPDETGERCIAPPGLTPGARMTWEVVDGPAPAGRMRQAFVLSPE